MHKDQDNLSRQLEYLQDENVYLKRQLHIVERRLLFYKISAFMLFMVEIALIYVMVYR